MSKLEMSQVCRFPGKTLTKEPLLLLVLSLVGPAPPLSMLPEGLATRPGLGERTGLLTFDPDRELGSEDVFLRGCSVNLMATVARVEATPTEDGMVVLVDGDLFPARVGAVTDEGFDDLAVAEDFDVADRFNDLLMTGAVGQETERPTEIASLVAI